MANYKLADKNLFPTREEEIKFRTEWEYWRGYLQAKIPKNKSVKLVPFNEVKEKTEE